MATWRIETDFSFLLWCKVVFRRINSPHYCSRPLHSLGSYIFYCLLIRLEGALPWNPILESAMGQGICEAKVPRPTDAHIPPRLTPVMENPASQTPMSLSPGSIHASLSVLWEGGLLVCVPLRLKGGDGTACIAGVNKAWMINLESPQVWTRPLLCVMETVLGREGRQPTDQAWVMGLRASLSWASMFWPETLRTLRL